MVKYALISRGTLLGVCSALLALPALASAQSVVVAGAGAVSIGTGLPISEDAAQAMIAKNLADVFAPSSDKNHVLIVVDATGQYVNGKAIKATVIHRTTGEDGQPNIVVTHDSGGTASGVVVTRFSTVGGQTSVGGPVIVAGTGAQSVMIARGENSASAGAAGAGMLGMGIAAADVETIGTKTIPAGQWRDEALTVTVIKLK